LPIHWRGDFLTVDFWVGRMNKGRRRGGEGNEKEMNAGKVDGRSFSVYFYFITQREFCYATPA